MREFAPSPMQAAALSRWQSASRTGAGNVQVSISFGEAVSPEALRGAWDTVSARHPILRSSFPAPGDGPLIVRVSPEAAAFWKTVDWQGEAPETIPSKWSALQAADAAIPFDSSVAPLVRFHEIRLPGGAFHYLLTFPSFLLDEFSVARVLTDWLFALGDQPLEAASESTPAPGGALSVWKEILEGAKDGMRLHPRHFPSSAGKASLSLGRDETSAFKEFCRTNDLEPAAVLQALWALVARRFGATGNVSLALFDTRDNLSEAGWFESWLPLTFPVEGSLLDVLKNVSKRWKLAAENARITTEGALAAVEGADFVESNLRFAWRGPHVNDLVHTALPRWINFDARLQATPAPGFELEVRDGFRMEFVLSGDPWTESAAKDLLGRLEKFLGELPELAEKPFQRVPVLDPEELRTLREWSLGTESAKTPATITALFREMVLVHGSSVAVQDGDYSLSYQELDSLSDRLAAHFSHAGLAGGWHAGLFLSQSSWIPIAILGALKAGNLIIPLDPSAPPEWIESKLAAHDAGVVLCDAASAPLLDTSTRRRMVLDQEWDALETSEAALPELTPDSPAAILPGPPDGAPPLIRALTHGLLSSAILAGARLLDFRAGDTFLAHSPAGGGAFLDEWLIPLLSGGTIRVADDETLDPATAPVTHVRLSAPEWANQAARASQGTPLTSDSLRVVAVEAGNPNVQVLARWQEKLPGGTRVFFSPAGLAGLGTGGVARPDAPFLSVGNPRDGIEVFVRGEDDHELPPFFAGDLFLRFPGWKSLTENTTKRGWCAGIRAWRNADGGLHIEAGSETPAGLPAFEDRQRILSVLEGCLDAHAGSELWTLAGPGGTFDVAEWPLTRGGWIDESLLPRPQPVRSPQLVKDPEPPRRAVVAAAAWNPIHVLQESGDSLRLILVPGAKGNPEMFANLASAIGGSRRILALRARGAANPEACHPTVESAAAAYVQAVLEDDPTGSFILAGYGFGATVALEMARQLQAAGRKAPRLLLIGATPPQGEKPGGWVSSFKSVFKKMTAPTPMEPGVLDDPVAEAHEVIWRKYSCPDVALQADLIAPADLPKESIAEWQELIPDLVVEPVKCQWSEILDYPAVKRLASLLADRA